jgi:hypothetical protein
VVVNTKFFVYGWRQLEDRDLRDKGDKFLILENFQRKREAKVAQNPIIHNNEARSN